MQKEYVTAICDQATHNLRKSLSTTGKKTWERKKDFYRKTNTKSSENKTIESEIEIRSNPDDLDLEVAQVFSKANLITSDVLMSILVIWHSKAKNWNDIISIKINEIQLLTGLREKTILDHIEIIERVWIRFLDVEKYLKSNTEKLLVAQNLSISSVKASSKLINIMEKIYIEAVDDTNTTSYYGSFTMVIGTCLAPYLVASYKPYLIVSSKILKLHRVRKSFEKLIGWSLCRYLRINSKKESFKIKVKNLLSDAGYDLKSIKRRPEEFFEKLDDALSDLFQNEIPIIEKFNYGSKDFIEMKVQQKKWSVFWINTTLEIFPNRKIKEIYQSSAKEILKDFSNKTYLKEMMSNASINQKQLADAIGVSPTSINLAVAGKRPVSMKLKAKLEMYFSNNANTPLNKIRKNAPSRTREK